MKILLLGENGSLGQQFKILFKSKKINFIGTSRKKLNLKFNYKNLKSIIYRTKPNIIINCIALTGLIYCEDKPQIAYQVNTKIPLNILKIIKNTEIKLIHFSSEAVFRGKTLKQAIKVGKYIGIDIKPVGYSGRVVWQSAKAGSKSNDIKICELKVE